MRALIVYAHPDREKSHNAAVLREVRSLLDSGNVPYSLIDLYADGFDPLMPHGEWAGEAPGPDVKKYQELIMGADRLIFIYPVWWYTYPAILKGFFDRVFTSDFAYNFRKEPAWMKVSKRIFPKWLLSIRLFYPIIYLLLPVKQHLRGKKAMVINTYGGDESGYRVYGNAPEYAADKAVLEFTGIRPVYRVNWYDTRHTKGPRTLPAQIKRDIDRKLEKLLRR